MNQSKETILLQCKPGFEPLWNLPFAWFLVTSGIKNRILDDGHDLPNIQFGNVEVFRWLW